MPAIQREVINKSTGEVLPVISTAIGNSDEQYIDLTVEGDAILRFSNIGNEGNLLNDEWEVREVPESSGAPTPSVEGEISTEAELPQSEEVQA